MTPEEITIEKAIELHDKHTRLRGNLVGGIDAVTEALNTINWIPIDADKLPEGDVLCCHRPTRVMYFTNPYKQPNSDRVFFESCNRMVWECTHYAHVNLP
jgi:hypothetical protein